MVSHRRKVLVYLHLLASPGAIGRLGGVASTDAAARELCRVWVEEIYVPGIRNLDGLKADRHRPAVEEFESEFSSAELALLYQFHRFLELRLEMLPKRRPEERRFPDGEFWQNIFRHARNVLDAIDPEGLEIQEVLESGVVRLGTGLG